MLKPEIAQERLNEFRTRDPKGKQLARIADLPERLRAISYNLLGYSAEGKALTGHEKTAKAQEAGLKGLEALESEARIRLFAAFHPKLGTHLEAAWNLHTRLPYEVGYNRKAFRTAQPMEKPLLSRRSWLQQIDEVLRGYEQDIVWFATWASYLSAYWSQDALGILLAAAIESGGEEGEAVFQTLLDSARGDHEIGAMGRHVTRALLIASRPDGWEFMEKMLLAAQRQEGLRQNILEAIDEAHPKAFRRMLRLILDHDLVRFSSVVRALDVWFGFGEQAGDTRSTRKILTDVVRFLDDETARKDALAQGDGQQVYLALWSLAFEETQNAIVAAEPILSDPNPERRFAAVYLLRSLGQKSAMDLTLPLLEDEDLRIAAHLLHGVAYYDYEEGVYTAREDTFEKLERLLPRCSRKQTELEPIIWDWMKARIGQSDVADALVTCLGKRSPKLLLPYLSLMTPYRRAAVVEKLAKLKKEDAPEVRETLFAMVGDAATYVREEALKAIGKLKVTEAEAEGLEALLRRKTADLRRGVLTVLTNQDNPQALASAERLLHSKDANQRLGGLEIVQQKLKRDKKESDQSGKEAFREAAARFAEERKERTDAEERLLGQLLNKERKEATLKDGLGLLTAEQRTTLVPPKPVPGFQEKSDAAKAICHALDALIHANRETEVVVTEWNGDKSKALLGNVQWNFPYPQRDIADAEFDAEDEDETEETSAERADAKPALTPQQDAEERLPLYALWEQWWEERPAELRDPDGMELYRASILISTANDQMKLKYYYVVERLIGWLLALHPPADPLNFFLDGLEKRCHSISAEQREKRKKRGHYYDQHLQFWLNMTRWYLKNYPQTCSEEQRTRLFHLVRWGDAPSLEEMTTAFKNGLVNEADMLDYLLIGDKERHFNELQALTTKRYAPLLEANPALGDLVRRIRERILEVELNRGDLPTAATTAALMLQYTGGLETLIAAMGALGKETLSRSGGYYYYYNEERGQSRSASFSHLIRASLPGAEDTPERFAQAVGMANLPTKRLVEVGFYAPQWAEHIARALGWDEFAEAVWWFHAHTKDTQWSVSEDIRNLWSAQVSERTPLTGQNLLDGAVDVAWFQRIYHSLGPERWTMLDDGAKYASGGGGHKRAQLFADAMLGRVEKAELVSRITNKRNQDAVRALGLLPISTDDPEADQLERYKILQEFVRTSKQFGAQRQASEKLAAQVGMENLARTAGYPDPIRLEWAMEAHAIADLAGGALVAEVGDVRVELNINALGEPNVSIQKNGKTLKAVPAALKKEETIVALMERKREVNRQTSRMRKSLEEAMCRGDEFTGAELVKLFEHPVLAPMLRSLVFLGEGAIGYPARSGRELERHDGETAPVRGDQKLRLAHPYDLMETGEWGQWQRDCFLRERIQPFKQVFRELYVLTAKEREDATFSNRYAGHQVNPRQAMALLNARSWVHRADEGEVSRTYHEAGIVAWLEFAEYFFTPAEVEGLTIENVRFAKRGEHQALPLEQVPPRLFSEAMRDMDLVVSVAHQGGVDPEASASTIEMRTAVIRETCGLLKIQNVRLEGSHALIDGELATYSVHLGSANVHRQPGGYLCIVPVHSQHRGRLFLPFVDDDPRTAEALSKVLLLAKDTEIKDPTILEQILPVARR